MPQKMYLINDPDMSEYFFNCLANAPRDKINELGVNEMKTFKNLESIRRFAEGETMEKRLLLLTRLGYKFCLIMCPENNDLSILDEVPEQYIKENRLEVIRAMMDQKVFVLSSSDVMMAAQMAAQNSHGQVFVLDYEYVKLREKLNKYVIVDALKDAMSSFDDLSKLALNTINSLEVSQSLAKVTPDEARVLFAMFPYRNTFMSITTIASHVNDSYRSRQLKRILDVLSKKGYLQRGKGRNLTVVYAIVDRGMDAAMKLMKYIVKQSCI